VSETSDFREWRAYLKKIVVEPNWTLATTGFLVTILYVGTWWRDNFGSDEWVKRLQLKSLLPHWHPAWWISIGLTVGFVVVVRASHQIYERSADDVLSLRKQLHDRQYDPLPVTAPQVRLIADSEPSLEPIDQLQLTNVSTSHAIFNIVFQPVRLGTGIFVVWQPNAIDVFEPGERVILKPLILATKDGQPTGPCDSLSGIAALHQSIRSRSKASNAYDIGNLAFSCEDSAQQRYLVTIKATLDLLGINLTVVDLNRVRIGSRPSIQPPA
jgi:hypothetical protein